MSPIDLKVLQIEPAEVYHGKAKENLSSHQLINFMRCPLLYQRQRAGLIDEKESSAYFIGRAAHCRILEGDHSQLHKSRYHDCRAVSRSGRETTRSYRCLTNQSILNENHHKHSRELIVKQVNFTQPF